MPKRWTLHHYHRYLGLAAGIFVLILSVTGIMLNHTEWLRLDKRKVSQPWLLKLYGIPEPQLRASFPIGDRWLMQWDEFIYLDEQEIAEIQEPINGTAAQNGVIAVSTPSLVTLFSSDGELVDQVPAPSPLVKLGLLTNGAIVAKGKSAAWRLNDDLTSLIAIQETDGTRWIAPKRPAGDDLKGFLAAFRGNGLPLERIILDLHSGRILGPAGVLLMDLAALMLITLALSGAYTWGRRKWRQR